MFNHEEFVWGYNYVPEINDENNGEVYFVGDKTLNSMAPREHEVNIRKEDVSAFIYFNGAVKLKDGKFEKECMVKVYMKNGTIFYLSDSDNEFDFKKKKK